MDPGTHERRFAALNAGLVKCACNLQQAFLCHLLYSEMFKRFGGCAYDADRWLETTYEALASRPTRLCCTMREARTVVHHTQSLGLINLRPLNDGTAGIELQLNWTGIESYNPTKSPAA